MLTASETANGAASLQCWLDVHRAMVTAREVDRLELNLVRRGLAFFHVPGSGHEVTAFLARHLRENDRLHVHYRDKALLVARGVPVDEFFASLLCRSGSHSDGRQMSAHFSAPGLNVLTSSGPVGNHALHAIGVAAALRDCADDAIVVCAAGDGTTQQGGFLEAIAEAVRWRLPVVFLIEDNHFAISTRTGGKTFWELPDRRADEFYGLALLRVYAANVLAADHALGQVIERARQDRAPAIVVLDVERLTDHSNADDQDKYRDRSEVARALAAADPIRWLEDYLIQCGICPSELRQVRSQIAADVEAAAARALALPEPTVCRTAKAPLPVALSARHEYRGRQAAPSFTMREAINGVLRSRLESDHRVFLYGQDIEDPKGDVFGVTRGLSRQFAGRVVNSPLSESTIVGTCIGRALVGQLPVAFIQFADFLPLAYNQLATELGSMYWRTNGGWQCPVIVMVTCGGYKPGLGPFHSHSLESIAAHTPGIDVVMPSSAGDAAGLLNGAFESGRPTIFFYPKSCLNLVDRATSRDVMQQFVPLGRARRVRTGDDVTLVTWGNTIEHCEQAAESLAAAGVETDLFDLRSLSPWDEAAIIMSAERTGRLVVVHEDNHTCGFGAEVAATVVEKAAKPVKIRRVARPDTFLPCNFGNQLEILPSYPRVLEAAVDLLELDIEWSRETEESSAIGVVRAIASGPADDRVEVVEIRAAVGEQMSAGDVVAVLEADKSVVDVVATFSGTVLEILAQPGAQAAVGQPLVRVQLSVSTPKPEVRIKQCPGTPILRPRVSIKESGSGVSKEWPSKTARVADTENKSPASTSEPTVRRVVEQNRDEHSASASIYACRPACALGSRIVTTEEIAEKIPGWTAAEAIKRTGVERRHWIAHGETAVSLATTAAEKLIHRLGPAIPKISAVLCSTTSAQQATPSISCQVVTRLRNRNCFTDGCWALDINAACSGFLYGLRLAFDHLHADVAGSVLVLTSEVLSPGISNYDPATAFLFGDAASATLLCKDAQPSCELELPRPLLAAAPDPDCAIRSPHHGLGFLQMNGVAVARTAYKFMADALRRSASEMQVRAIDLAAVLPHPGSIRIVQNVAELSGVPYSKVWHTLSDTGNTSSSSIPIALDSFWDKLPRNVHVGMTAFGAGFTSASVVAILRGD